MPKSFRDHDLVCTASRLEKMTSPVRPSRTTAQLTADIAAGIRVLRDRDGVPVTEEQVMERARNIVTGLLGNYRIESED